MGTQWKLKETHVKDGKEHGNIMTVYSLELSLFSCESDYSRGLLVEHKIPFLKREEDIIDFDEVIFVYNKALYMLFI